MRKTITSIELAFSSRLRRPVFVQTFRQKGKLGHRRIFGHRDIFGHTVTAEWEYNLRCVLGVFMVTRGYLDVDMPVVPKPSSDHA